MRASKPEVPGTVVELSSDDLVEVDDNRASIIAAAASAQNIAMLTGTHGVISPPLLRPRARLPLPGEIHRGALPDPDDAELGRLRAFVAARTGDPVGLMQALPCSGGFPRKDGVAVVDGQMVDAVHLRMARDILRRTDPD